MRLWGLLQGDGSAHVTSRANTTLFKDLKNVFESATFLAVIHFAGLKAVGESVQKPLEYYQVMDVTALPHQPVGTIALCL